MSTTRNCTSQMTLPWNVLTRPWKYKCWCWKVFKNVLEFRSLRRSDFWADNAEVYCLSLLSCVMVELLEISEQQEQLQHRWWDTAVSGQHLWQHDRWTWSAGTVHHGSERRSDQPDVGNVDRILPGSMPWEPGQCCAARVHATKTRSVLCCQEPELQCSSWDSQVFTGMQSPYSLWDSWLHLQIRPEKNLDSKLQLQAQNRIPILTLGLIVWCTDWVLKDDIRKF